MVNIYHENAAILKIVSKIKGFLNGILFAHRDLMKKYFFMVFLALGIFFILFLAYSKDYEVRQSKVETSTKQFPVTVQRNYAPSVKTDKVDHFGRAIEVDCVSCHATKEANVSLQDSGQLKEFHQGMNFKHGELSCLSCHNKNDYNSLRKADGESISYENVIKLCAQCHGPKYRDYKKGVHGGMTGYWDLSKGPRFRNNCINCHDAHAPAFPKFNPVFPPKDRFLKKDKYHD